MADMKSESDKLEKDERLWSAFEELILKEIAFAKENGTKPGMLDAIKDCVRLITLYRWGNGLG